MDGAWDFVVVGGGTAGCVLAARLAAAGHRILVLEAGPRYPRLRLGVPLPSLRAKERYSWHYASSPQDALDGRRLSLPVGRVLGGSSSINAMIYYRGPASVFTHWGPGWSWEEVLPYYRQAVNYIGASAPWHGSGGPVDVSPPRHLAPFSHAFLDACAEAGIPACADFQAPRPDGAGVFPLTQQRGERVTTARAYLARSSPTVRVVTGALVHRIRIERGRATGVEFTAGGRWEFARAAREVWVCAGAINTPKLLWLSGLGPAGDLERLDIPVVEDLPGVGQRLQDHVRVPVLYHGRAPSPGRVSQWIPAGLNWLLFRRGVMASNCCEAGALVRSDDRLPEPDLQFVTHFQSHLHPRAVDLQFCLMSTRSLGQVRLRSVNPAVPPDVDPAYLSAPGEMAAVLAGVAWARRLAATRALQAFGLGAEILPGRDRTTEDALTAYARSVAETCYHLAGTCAMGAGRDAVVDAELRVRGVSGVRIADASIMPVLVEGNPMATVLMIAERAAALAAGHARILT